MLADATEWAWETRLRQGAINAVGKCDQPQTGHWTFFLPNLFRWDLVIFASFEPQQHVSERENASALTSPFPHFKVF